jgi:hypothetical protein
MKWLPFMIIFVLEKICEIIKTGFRTDKDFKEIKLTALAIVLLEHCGVDVRSTHVHLDVYVCSVGPPRAEVCRTEAKRRRRGAPGGATP